MINIVCFKWGTKYPSVYVNRLYHMIKMHTPAKYWEEGWAFHCFTDDPKGIDDKSNLEIHELIDPDFKGAWHQATIFNPDIPIKGRILYLDLDIVIVDNLWEILEQEGDFVINKDWNWHGYYNGSAFMFDAGAWSDAWRALQDIKKHVKNEHLGAQKFITEFFRNKATFWPEGWIVSYKKHAIGGPPEGAKIVVFHGDPNPHDAIWGWKGWPPEQWVIEHWGGPI